MKKFFAVIIVTLSVSAALSAQTRWPDINKYEDLMYAARNIPRNNKVSPSYYGMMDQTTAMQYAKLDGNEEYLDTALEWALCFYYIGSSYVPPEAEAILPHSKPKQADTQLGALVYKRIVESRFLANTAAVGKYEEILRAITGRGNVSRAEIEAYYRQGIAGLVAEAVDEEFNKISFRLDKGTTISYTAVLTRNTQNQYILSYERPSIENDDKELPPASLETLLATMRRNTTDFDQTSIDQVRTQAALIPAVKLSPSELGAIKDILTIFYLRPNSGTYNALRDVGAVYDRLTGAQIANREAYIPIVTAYGSTVASLSRELSNKMESDIANNPNGVSRTTTVETIRQQISAQR